MPFDTNPLTIHNTSVGNTRTSLAVILKQGGFPVDLSGLTVKVEGDTDAGVAWITETTTGVTAEGTTTFTANASTDKLTASNHKLPAGTQLKLSTTTTLPDGLSDSQFVYVREPEQHKFRVSETPDGPLIDLLDAGSGTHSYAVVGEVKYDFQAADVDTAGTFYLWFNVYSGSEFDTFPCDGQKMQVKVNESA